MKRQRLKNKFLREKNQANRDNYKKITDNRTFWKTVFPLFTNKPPKCENIIINEGDKSISDEKNFLKYLTNFFLMLCPT